MNTAFHSQRPVAANAVFRLLNPIPFGFFVAALIFDVVYARSGEIMWVKSAAWLLAIGLVIAVVPRLINLVHVWTASRHVVYAADKIDFWLNFVAIAVAILNSFVHSRDAYAAMPVGVWLSACTVILLAIANLAVSLQRVPSERLAHE